MQSLASRDRVQERAWVEERVHGDIHNSPTGEHSKERGDPKDGVSALESEDERPSSLIFNHPLHFEEVRESASDSDEGVEDFSNDPLLSQIRLSKEKLKRKVGRPKKGNVAQPHKIYNMHNRMSVSEAVATVTSHSTIALTLEDSRLQSLGLSKYSSWAD